jgi:hypothetical protein
MLAVTPGASGVLYVSSTSSQGTTFGVGQVRVVDAADPANLSQVTSLEIPGTVEVMDIAVRGNRALVAGTTANFQSAGNIALSVLDLTDPRNPQRIGTTIDTGFAFVDGKLVVEDLGNGQFAVSRAGRSGTNSPVILLVDLTNPTSPTVTPVDVTASVGELAATGDRLYTASADGLAIYRIPNGFDPPFRLVGQASTTNLSTTIIVRGNVGYVAGTNGVDIVDVSNPVAPVRLSTFAQDLIVRGGFTVIRPLSGDRILIGSTVTLNATGFRLLTYSVSDPLNPVLLTNTFHNQAFLSDLAVSGSTVLVTTLGSFFFGPADAGDAFNQFGDVTAIDLDAPGGPAISDRLFGNGNPPFTGPTVMTGGTIADADTAYVTSSSRTGGEFLGGTGRLLVVNFADPSNLVLTREVLIPGTAILSQVAIQGNIGLVVGSNRGDQDPWNNLDNDPSNDSGNTGNLTLTTLDITDRDNPVVLSTVVTAATFPRGSGFPITKLAVTPVGDGKFAISLGIVDGEPVIFLVDASDPASPAVAAFEVHSVVNEMTFANGLLYTTSADGLIIYNVGDVQFTPVTASVRVPKGSVVADSFNIAPTRIDVGPDFDTLVWERRLAFGLNTESITWQSSLAGLQPGETRPVTLGADVTFVSQSQPGSIVLPGTGVAVEHVIGLTPSARTVRPGEPAAFTVTLRNPTSSALTYSLDLQGLPDGWESLEFQATVPAHGTLDVPLILTAPAFAALADHGFVVVATTFGGVHDSVQGTLTLVGEPLNRPDPQARAVVLALTPASATAGQGTSATYLVRVTNTGSLTDTFDLDVQGLPIGVTAVFNEPAPTVAPGAGNYREVTLVLTAARGTVPGPYAFTVDAISRTLVAVRSEAAGTLSVLPIGVDVRLTPSSAAPGSPFVLTVTNTGGSAGTFDLALAGPGALAARLARSTVTLDPGASESIAIASDAVDGLLPGLVDLVAYATAEADPAVRDADRASLAVTPTRGLGARLDPPERSLSAPGTARFEIVVENTGNLADAFSAEIVGTTGPLASRIIGSDGSFLRSLDGFQLPALTTGRLILEADLQVLGQGTVTVRIRSLSDPNLVSEVTATVVAGAVATTTTVVVSPGAPIAGLPITLTASVAGAGGAIPTGTVTFLIDGAAQAPVALEIVNGQAIARLVLSGLLAGTHTIAARYDGASGFDSSTSASSAIVVSPDTAPGRDTTPPVVVSVARFGVHAQPTRLVLSFSEDLDPAEAANLVHYRVMGPGRDGRLGTPDDRPIRLRRVSYDAATRSVTLLPAARLPLRGKFLVVVLDAGVAGVVDRSGNPLDGDGDGRPGGAFRATVGRQSLVLDGSVPSAPRRFPSARKLVSKAGPHGPGAWATRLAHRTSPAQHSGGRARRSLPAD